MPCGPPCAKLDKNRKIISLLAGVSKILPIPGISGGSLKPLTLQRRKSLVPNAQPFRALIAEKGGIRHGISFPVSDHLTHQRLT